MFVFLEKSLAYLFLFSPVIIIAIVLHIFGVPRKFNWHDRLCVSIFIFISVYVLLLPTSLFKNDSFVQFVYSTVIGSNDSSSYFSELMSSICSNYKCSNCVNENMCLELFCVDCGSAKSERYCDDCDKITDNCCGICGEVVSDFIDCLNCNKRVNNGSVKCLSCGRIIYGVGFVNYRSKKLVEFYFNVLRTIMIFLFLSFLVSFAFGKINVMFVSVKFASIFSACVGIFLIFLLIFNFDFFLRLLKVFFGVDLLNFFSQFEVPIAFWRFGLMITNFISLIFSFLLYFSFKGYD